MNKEINARFIILIGVVFVSFGSIFTKISSAPSLAIATYRLGFTSLILLPYVLMKNLNEIKGISIKNLLICLLSGIFLAFHFATWIESINHTSIASSTLLVNTHPIFIVIGSVLILKEKISKRSIITIVITLIGMIIISLGNSSIGDTMIYGDFLAVLGGFCVAGYIMIGRVARQELSVNSYTFIVYSSSTITLFILSLITNTPLYPYPKLDWLLFLSLAVFCTILGHSIFNWSLEYLNPAFVSTVMLGEPVFATLWAILFFKEFPSIWQILGGTVILLGIYKFIQTTENTSESI
ncbi:DMT family transporter [Maledivibacter halophilus]|uniref:Permease of the drug/metabolite transporter (DMT) superfamily n=1 Tax=Maledivibacter halophilus TaxID=36842 RepID=A0A1T5J6J0_9FIRM|nr:DMT family transporter [Maledivibacter halophilus]SKC46994.1 Permease of the drug/metabolite transporter (DMT) superfamily [Maledivibacter halophilus]